MLLLLPTLLDTLSSCVQRTFALGFISHILLSLCIYALLLAKYQPSSVFGMTHQRLAWP